MSYTKLFNSIITSTIWTEDDKTRIIWITMMAMADKNGEIQGSIPGLARVAGVSVKDTEESLNKFLSPDPYSRTKDDEGRRIEEIDGGWALINHAKYRRMASKEDQKEKATERKRRQREREKAEKSVTPMSRSVTPRHGEVTPDRDIAEAEAEAEKKIPPSPPRGECEGGGKLEPKKPNRPTLDEFTDYLLEALPEINPEWTPERINRAAKLQHDTFIENGWKDGNGKAVRNWKVKTRNIMTHKKPWSYGSGTTPEAPKPPPKPVAGPDGWQKAFRRLIPNGQIPIQWDHVDADLQGEILGKLKRDVS